MASSEAEYMTKKAIIVITLVKESALTGNKQIEQDILNELSNEPAKIPWLKTVEKVTVTEE
ncbi:MAG: hypothetical protein QHH18_07375 [Candidatus Bathyarchaeota archaeon]|jgi:hypothetical protein|nr:hypothetical protein [Candidatus Bathyarchaeota archaeon]